MPDHHSLRAQEGQDNGDRFLISRLLYRPEMFPRELKHSVSATDTKDGDTQFGLLTE